jgi:ferritin
MDKELALELNSQITKEIYSSNLYLAMSAYFAAQNFNGFAHWLRLQSQEELAHGLKIFDYMILRGTQPIVSQINAPPSTWATVLEAFEMVYSHEQLVTASINELLELAISKRDRATENMLRWFVDEQVEEEATASELLERLRLINNNPQGLFMMDRELKFRQ